MLIRVSFFLFRCPFTATVARQVFFPSQFLQRTPYKVFTAETPRSLATATKFITGLSHLPDQMLKRKIGEWINFMTLLRFNVYCFLMIH